MKGMRVVAAAVLLGVLAGCAAPVAADSPAGPGPDQQMQEQMAPNGGPAGQALELKVLAAIGDQYARGAGWDARTSTMTVTLYTDDVVFTPEQLAGYQRRAEAVLPDGARVVLVLQPGGPPVAD